jgi:uncharacterized iron-regulated membrane protein
MTAWQRWLQAPATLPLRRLLFQVHLWLGIGLGLYVLMISVSGSAIVLRPQIARWFTHNQVVSTQGTELTEQALARTVAEVYRDYEILKIVPATRPGRATYVALANDGVEHTRYFDQFSGLDLGSTFPWQVATVEWLTRLHDELLLDRDGRQVNGIGGVLLLGMTFSGVILWWQGKQRWADGLQLKRHSPRSWFWQLHSLAGFWTLALLLVWGVTAIYFAWPEPFDRLIDWMDDDLTDEQRPDAWLLLLIRLHFGRFGGVLWANILWMVLGLVPAFLFISGLVLWYRRVVRRWLGRLK